MVMYPFFPELYCHKSNSSANKSKMFQQEREKLCPDSWSLEYSQILSKIEKVS